MRHLWIWLLVIVMTLPGPVWAEGETDPIWNRGFSYEQKVMAVGQRILDANGLEDNITFVVERSNKRNAYVQDAYGRVVIYQGMLRYIENDDELAMLLGHEIAHVLKRHGLKSDIGSTLNYLAGAFAGGYTGNPLWGVASNDVDSVSTNLYSNNQEEEADLIGTDLMVGAGYHPIYAERFIRKIAGDGWALRWMRSHPEAEERLDNLRRHIATRYPQYLTRQQLAAWAKGEHVPLTTYNVNLHSETLTPQAEAMMQHSQVPTALEKSEGLLLMQLHEPTAKAQITPPSDSLAEHLLSLSNEQLAVLRLFKTQEVLDQSLLFEQLGDVSPEYRETLMNDLVTKQFIRVLNSNSGEELYILTENAAETFGLY